MRIKYLGPSGFVFITPYGDHQKGETKEYPDEFGKELIATSKKQKFEAVDGRIAETKALEDMTVADLKALLDKLKVSYDSRATKAVLTELIKTNTAEPLAELR